MQKFLVLLLFPIACLANEDALTVDAECRGEIPHGAYVVASAAGAVRIEGRYADGLRSGIFTFFGPAGGKLIVLPYTKGLIDGTVRAWHAPDGTDSGLKLISDISAGFIEGRYRTWYENGNPRSDFVVENGEIVSAETWNPDGSALEIGDPSALLQADIDSDFAYYARLEQVMDSFPPACAAR
jgi:hypothetical protein